MQTPTNLADLTLWTLLGDELDAAALPLPARVPNANSLDAIAIRVRVVIEQQLACTVRPGKAVMS